MEKKKIFRVHDSGPETFELVAVSVSHCGGIVRNTRTRQAFKMEEIYVSEKVEPISQMELAACLQDGYMPPERFFKKFHHGVPFKSEIFPTIGQGKGFLKTALAL